MNIKWISIIIIFNNILINLFLVSEHSIEEKAEPLVEEKAEPKRLKAAAQKRSDMENLFYNILFKEMEKKMSQADTKRTS